MKTIDSTDLGPFITPPCCQGQIMVVSYQAGPVDSSGMLVRRKHDHSDGMVEYHWADGSALDESWHPCNSEPNIEDDAWVEIRVCEGTPS